MLNKCERSIKERRVFKYGYCSILHYMLWWVPWRKKRSLRKNPVFRSHAYFRVGQEKLLEELDWVTIIKAIRQLKILTQVLLNKDQRFLIKFQRKNVIDSTSSGTSDEGQMNIVGM